MAWTHPRGLMPSGGAIHRASTTISPPDCASPRHPVGPLRRRGGRGSEFREHDAAGVQVQRVHDLRYPVGSLELRGGSCASTSGKRPTMVRCSTRVSRTSTRARTARCRSGTGDFDLVPPFTGDGEHHFVQRGRVEVGRHRAYRVDRCPAVGPQASACRTLAHRLPPGTGPTAGLVGTALIPDRSHGTVSGYEVASPSWGGGAGSATQEGQEGWAWASTGPPSSAEPKTAPATASTRNVRPTAMRAEPSLIS